MSALVSQKSLASRYGRSPRLPQAGPFISFSRFPDATRTIHGSAKQEPLEDKVEKAGQAWAGETAKDGQGQGAPEDKTPNQGTCPRKDQGRRPESTAAADQTFAEAGTGQPPQPAP